MKKTNVSILQELAMQRKGLPPQYELLPSEGVGTHQPTFHYRVIVENVVAEGKARSKKEAKHEAAKNALEKLCTIGIYHPTHVATPPAASTSSHSSPAHLQVNSIGALQDLCTENNIQQPTFQLTADIGPPHCREFTIQCKIATLTTTASESTKKRAKQLAAQKMLHRMMDTLPEVIAELPELTVDNSADMLAIKLEYAAKSYNELNKNKTNWGLKISSYPHAFKSKMEETNLTYDSLWKGIHNMPAKDETMLRSLLQRLDMCFTSEYMDNEENSICTLTINSQPTFVVCEIADTEEEALCQAVEKCFEFLEIMTK